MAIDPSVLTRFADLESLSDVDRRQMAASLTETRFKSGAQLCRDGDASDCCWFLVEGSVEITKELPDGRRVKLATLGPGTAIGQSGLVKGQTRTAEVKAVENIHVLSLTQRSLKWSLGRGEPWAVAVQAIVAINLVRQLRSALSRLSELAGAEDASKAVTGRSRDQIARPKSVNVDFSKVRAKQAAEAAKSAAEAALTGQEQVAAELAEYDETGEIPLEHQGLMNLLRDTEASLSGFGVALDDVEFVMDEDMRRTAQARGNH